jgi:1,2-diacylglycerol 3-beta-galactosyltransferase
VADFYGRCDEVGTVSEDAAKTLRSYGYKNDITVVQNGTEMRTPSPYLETVARERSGLGEQPILLYVGQLDYKKNLRMLIEAAALLKKQGHAFQLVFAGQGRDKTKLAESAVKQGLGGNMKQILILMADFGYGHRSASNAISEALQEIHGQECVVEIVNLFDDPHIPPFMRRDQANYDRLVREMPELYQLGYRVSDRQAVSTLIRSTATLLLFNALRETIHQHQPDVIVCTYPIYPPILSAIFAREKYTIPVLSVVTDLATVHKLWFHPSVDLCLVPTQTVYDLAINAGLPPEKVKITGIPVHPALAKGRQDQTSIRLELGWRTDLFTVLVVGSKRVGNLYDSLRVLNHSGLPLQLALVAGGDNKLFQRLEETEWHLETHLYNFVTDMATLLRAADCVLGKAGGLTVTEALACGLPLILVNVIPGQETGNAEYVISGQAGDLAQDPIEVLEVMSHWLDKDKELYNQRVQNAYHLGYPRAAYDVAKLVWDVSMAPVT